MDLSDHLNVITGETGAGKSIMLGALGLLLGNRADTKVLWDPNEKCITEGTFNIQAYNLQSVFEQEDLDYDPQTVLRREISAAGKSRAFVNDTPVNLDVMKRVGSLLMDIHSQHETLNLATREFQLRLIDSFASNHKIRQSYLEAWKTYEQQKGDYEKLQNEAASLKQESDFVNFQLKELSDANLEEGEQARLEEDLQIMEHAEDIKTKFNTILSQLDQSEMSTTAQLSEVRSMLSSLSNYSENYRALYARFDSLRIELGDIINEIENEDQKIDFDPRKIEETNERLSLIYQLQQKHRLSSISELIKLQNELQQKANRTTNLDQALENAKVELEKSHKLAEEEAGILSKSRVKIFSPHCEQIINLLKELGIPDAKLKVEHQKIDFGPNGADHVELLFSANKGVPERPLGQVASGGEFSRLMFCVKYVLAEKVSLPTLVLDEIDTGVSGEIAIRLGKMMKVMAKKHQLMTISHLPQIAAKADSHFYAYKQTKSAKTISQIRKLTEAERIDEIAKMIAGEKPSSLAIENAKELIKS